MNDRLRLILLSFLMLFVELALIRWAGSNVVYLSYFSNFVLLGSFLGIGLGFLRANRKRDCSRGRHSRLARVRAPLQVEPCGSARTTAVFFFSAAEAEGAAASRSCSV